MRLLCGLIFLYNCPFYPFYSFIFLFFLYFFKKVAETFCGYLKSCYLCTRFPQGGLD